MSDQDANNGGPIGLELNDNLSFARLNPLAGELARKTGEPQLCGWITGTVWAAVHSKPEEETQFGPFTRLVGELYALPWNRGQEISATGCFLPPVAERFVLAALEKGVGGVPICYEGWAFPDDRKGGVGYRYRVWLRQPAGVLSAAKRMAIAAGIIEAPPAPPPLELAGPEEPIYNPETGEIATDDAGRPVTGQSLADVVAGRGRGKARQRAPDGAAEAIAAE